MVRGSASPTSIFSTYRLSASGCLSQLMILPTLKSSTFSASRSAPAAAADPLLLAAPALLPAGAAAAPPAAAAAAGAASAAAGAAALLVEAAGTEEPCNNMSHVEKGFLGAALALLWSSVSPWPAGLVHMRKQKEDDTPWPASPYTPTLVLIRCCCNLGHAHVGVLHTRGKRQQLLPVEAGRHNSLESSC